MFSSSTALALKEEEEEEREAALRALEGLQRELCARQDRLNLLRDISSCAHLAASDSLQACCTANSPIC